MKSKFLFFFILISFFAQAQNYYLPANNFYSQLYLKKINISDTFVHTLVKPLRFQILKDLKYDVFDQKKHKFKNKIPKHFFDEDLVVIHKKDLEIRGNLLGHFHKTYPLKNSDSLQEMQNTRGFNIYGTVGKNLSFYTAFYENQTVFPEYINIRNNKTGTIPGCANWKDFGDYGKDYNCTEAYISWSPWNFLNITTGTRKIFIGEGYRSLFISDNSHALPQFSFQITKGHWQYTSLFAETQQFRGRYYAIHTRRHLTMQTLSFANKYAEIALLEGIMWHTSDDSTYVKHFPALFFVPVPLVRLPYTGMNGKHNALVGLNLKFKPLKYTEIYAQFVYDNKNKYAWQSGLKFYNLFFTPSDRFNWFLRLEHNYITPHTYQHSDVNQAWIHYNQALAHTFGSDLSENLIITNLKITNFIFTFEYDIIKTDNPYSEINTGSWLLTDYYTTDETNPNTKPYNFDKEKIINIIFSAAYVINYKTNLQIFFTYQNRKTQTLITKNELNFLFFGIKTNLKNFYYDF